MVTFCVHDMHIHVFATTHVLLPIALGSIALDILDTLTCTIMLMVISCHECNRYSNVYIEMFLCDSMHVSVHR